MAIPSISPIHPLQASRRLLEKGIATPYCFPLPTEDTNWKVAFEPPGEISLVGSWANKTCVKAKDGIKFGVDLAVEMPPVRHKYCYIFGLSLTWYTDSVPREGLSQRAFLPEKSILLGNHSRSRHNLRTWSESCR